MIIADDRQRFMPLPDDRTKDRGQVLAYPEAVLLVDPVEPEFKGEVFYFQTNQPRIYTLIWFMKVMFSIEVMPKKKKKKKEEKKRGLKWVNGNQ